MRRWFLRSPFVVLSIGLLALVGGGGPDAVSSMAAAGPASSDDESGTVAAARGTLAPTTTGGTSGTTTVPSSTTTTVAAASADAAATTTTPPAEMAPRPADPAPTVPPTVPTTVPATVPPTTSVPAAADNAPGHFSGRMFRDGRPLPDVTVKVVNIHTPGWPRLAVLDTLGGHDGIDVFVTTTDARGAWSVTGLPAGKQFMLKVFPPSVCDAYGEIAAAYTTAEAGFIDSTGEPFMSTRLAPGSRTYNVWSSGRFLFDLPVHVYPTVPGALDGGRGYGDLDVRFHTRVGAFATSRGAAPECTPAE